MLAINPLPKPPRAPNAPKEGEAALIKCLKNNDLGILGASGANFGEIILCGVAAQRRAS